MAKRPAVLPRSVRDNAAGRVLRVPALLLYTPIAAQLLARHLRHAPPAAAAATGRPARS